MNELEKAYQEIEGWHCYAEQEGFVDEEEISYLDYVKNCINNLQSKIDEAIELNENIRKKLLTCSSYEKDKVEDLLFEQLDILKDDKIQEIPQFKGTMEQLDELCEVKK